MYKNYALAIGNLTKDPELKALPSGVKTTSFIIAINTSYRDNNNEKKEETDYIQIQVYGKLADTCAMYLHKGSNVMAEGRFKTRSWEKSDGTKGYQSFILATSVQFGPKDHDENNG